MATLLLGEPMAAHAQDTPAQPPSPEALLRQMSVELKQASRYAFHAEINFDHLVIPLGRSVAESDATQVPPGASERIEETAPGNDGADGPG